MGRVIEAVAAPCEVVIQCWPRGEYLPSEVVTAAAPKLKDLLNQIPNGFIFRFAGQHKEQVSGFGDLMIVLGICILAICLALLGAVIALAIMKQPFGFMAFLGVISLIVLIVIHIIVLFEFVEERREQVEELELALVDAGILRLRPVMITVSAIVIALFPLATHGGPLWEQLCYAQIGALKIATFITLSLVPILYLFGVLDFKWVQWEDKTKREHAADSAQDLPPSPALQVVT